MSNLNEQLRVTLGIVRERIEICRAVERDIEALLVSEGAVYPEPAVAPVTPAAEPTKAVHPWRIDKQKAAKKAAKKAVKAEAAVGVCVPADRQKVCPHCKTQYLAKRKDQTNCLKPACRKATAKFLKENWELEKAKLQAAPKAPVAPKAAPAADPVPVSRIDRIKAAAARLDGIPDGVRAAAAEALESEAL